VVPLRERLGFTVDGAWVAALTPNPAELIVESQTHLMSPLAS